MKFDRHGGDIYSRSGVSLDFSVNLNPLGTPEAVRRAVRDSAAVCDAYPDPRCIALTAAASEAYSLPESYFVFGNGAADLIVRTVMTLKPRRALIPAPTFSEYASAVRLSGGEAQFFDLNAKDGFAIGKDLAAAISPGTDLVFLCNPNNPTGRLAENGTAEALLDACGKVGAYLVVDECFLDFTEGESFEKYIPFYNNLIILRAFTKMYAMAGVRLGYLLCGDPVLCEKIRDWGQSWSVSTTAQMAGIAALGIRDYAARTRAFLAMERPRMASALESLGYVVFPSQANFLLFRGGAGLWRQMLDRGILLRACGNYRNLDETYYRIGLKDQEKNDILLKLLTEGDR